MAHATMHSTMLSTSPIALYDIAQSFGYKLHPLTFSVTVISGSAAMELSALCRNQPGVTEVGYFLLRANEKAHNKLLDLVKVLQNQSA